jgi:hypothetical protein
MLDEIPAQLYAGDTWKWSASFADYSAADGWTLTTSFRGAGTLDVVGVADSDGFTNTATAVSTGGLTAGRYSWTSRVEKDGETYTVDSGTLEVIPSLADEDAGYDGRTDAEKQLEAAEASLTSLLGSKNESVTFGDQTFKRQDIEKLTNIRDRLRSQVAREKRAANGRAGRRIKVEFGS